MNKRTFLFLLITLCLLIAAMVLPLSAAAAGRTTIGVSDLTYHTRSGDYITGVEMGYTVAEMKDILLNDAADLTFTSADGSALGNSSFVGTGTVLTLTLNGSVADSCQAVVKADIDGNGRITALDYLSIKRHFNGDNILTGAKAMAADVDDNGNVTTSDYGKIKAYFNTGESLYPEHTDYSRRYYVDLSLDGIGYAVYEPYSSGYGYRYGATMLKDENGGYNMWLASAGYQEMDWIVYQHSDTNANRASWTTERVVLQPTGDSRDRASVCDPGVIYFNGYYYLGYTATSSTSNAGYNNSIFVARSKDPDGPFIEKWNGSGWGYDPAPMIHFDGPTVFVNDGTSPVWGCGEPSFVVVDDVLYVYYRWVSYGTDVSGNMKLIWQIRVSTADATDENWPATLRYMGTLTDKSNDSRDHDSVDVAFVKDYNKWVAVGCNDVRTENSCITVYQSNDGISFTEVNEIRTNVMTGCHNIGIAKDLRGHIDPEDGTYVCYAYAGTNGAWGHWSTRIQPLNLGIVYGNKPANAGSSDYSITVNTVTAGANDLIGLSSAANFSCFDGIYAGAGRSPRYYRKSIDDGNFRVTLRCFNHILGTSSSASAEITDAQYSKVTYSGYDTSIIGFTADKKYIIPKKPGTTYVTATWAETTTYFSTTFKVTITPSGRAVDVTLPDVESFEFQQSQYRIRYLAGSREAKQVRLYTTFADGNRCELFNNPNNTKYPASNSKYHITYSIDDTSVAFINEQGVITPLKVGNCNISVTMGGVTKTVPLEVFTIFR